MRPLEIGIRLTNYLKCLTKLFYIHCIQIKLEKILSKIKLQL
jgi:hypothetical protein